jgi:hypothetical protein
MKLIFSIFLALPLAAEVVCLPYSATLLKQLQGVDVQRERMVPIVTPKTCTDKLTGKPYDCPVTTYELKMVTEFDRVPTAFGLMFGDPAIEKEGTVGRRMCFAHDFSAAELTGLKRMSDLTWARKRIEAVAVKEKIAAALDTPAALTAKVAAITKVTAKLPVDWKPPVADAKAEPIIEEKPIEGVKVIK